MTERTIHIGLIVAAIFISATLVFAREMDMRTLRKRIATLESTASTTVDRMDRNKLCTDCHIVDVPESPAEPEADISVRREGRVEDTACYGYYVENEQYTKQEARDNCESEMYTKIPSDKALQLLMDASGLKYRAETEEVTEAVPAKLVK